MVIQFQIRGYCEWMRFELQSNHRYDILLSMLAYNPIKLIIIIYYFILLTLPFNMTQPQRFTYAPISSYQPIPQGQPAFPLLDHRKSLQPVSVYQNTVNVTDPTAQVRAPSSTFTFGGNAPAGPTQPYRISFNHGPSSVVPVSRIKPGVLQAPLPQQATVTVNETVKEKATIPVVQTASGYNVNEFKTIKEGDFFSDGCCSCFSPKTFESKQKKGWC